MLNAIDAQENMKYTLGASMEERPGGCHLAGAASSGQKRRRSGFTLTEIMIVVTLVALLLTIVTPNYVRARSSSQAATCIGNLKKIEWAKWQWSLENRKAREAMPTEAELSPYFPTQKVPLCPAAGIYIIEEVADPPRCSLGEEGHVLPLADAPPDHAVANSW